MNTKYNVKARISAVLILTTCFLAFGLAVADDDLQSKTTLRQLELQAHKERIRSSSIEEAIAATEIGLNSGDQELRSMTLEAALSSDNASVQTTALRWIFTEKKSIAFHLINPRTADNGTSYTYKLWRGHVLKDFDFDPATDEIQLNKSNFRDGHLVRGGFELEYSWYPERREGYRCTFVASVDKEAFMQDKLQLKGNVDCMFPALKNHPAKGDEDGIVAFTINLS